MKHHLHKNIGEEIAAVEKRISLRRERLLATAHTVRERLGSSLLSPSVLSAVATFGFGVGRVLMSRRASPRPKVKPPRNKKARLLSLVSSAAMTGLRLRFGAPAAMVARFVSSHLR